MTPSATDAHVGERERTETHTCAACGLSIETGERVYVLRIMEPPDGAVSYLELFHAFAFCRSVARERHDQGRTGFVAAFNHSFDPERAASGVVILYKDEED